MFIHLSYANVAGFWGCLLTNRHDDIGTFMGDIGSRTRAWWRAYARREGYKLIEAARD